MNDRARLLEIIKAKSVRHGTFTLASGAISDFYLDLKPTAFDAEGAVLIGRLILEEVRRFPEVSAVGGLELGAVPLVSAVGMASWPDAPIGAFVVRKAKKDHGTEQPVDGNFVPGSTVIILDDVTTKGGSSLQAVEAVRTRGGKVAAVISVVDRLEGARENLAAAGIPLVALFDTAQVLA